MILVLVLLGGRLPRGARARTIPHDPRLRRRQGRRPAGRERLDRVHPGGRHGRQPAIGPDPARRLVRGRRGRHRRECRSAWSTPRSGSRGNLLFGPFTTPIRRRIPDQSGGPLEIDLLEEAVRYQAAASGPTTTRPTTREPAMKTDTIEMPRVDLPPVAGRQSASRLSRRRGRDPPRLAERPARGGDPRPRGTLWVDIENPDGNSTEQVEALLRNVFGFHPLAIEDALQESHIPKVDDWGDYLYLVFHGTSIDPQTDELRLHELDIFLGPNYLVTYHTEPLSFLDQDRKAIERDPRDRLQHGCDHLLFRFLERAVDQSLEAIEHLDDRVDEIQNQVIENPRAETLQTIFRIKRSAIRLHKIFGPQREVLNRLARDPYKPIQPEHRVYFRDVYDHVVRIHDISESLRDLIAGTLETYLSVMSNRTNDIMKTLTMVTVMFMPMSFIIGFFGMNFFGETLAFQTPSAQGVPLLRVAPDHVRFAGADVDLRAAQEVVLGRSWPGFEQTSA